MTAPQPPFRVDLATFLISEGRAAEADQEYRCACGKTRHASLFKDVRDQQALFTGQAFVCDVCVSDLERRELVAHECAMREWLASQGHLDAGELNLLRGRRDAALARTDWTQLQDNRERLGADAATSWDAYRSAVRSWFATARDTAVVGEFPEPPGDASPSTDTVSMEPET